jgi:hypothetical protein
MIHWYGGTELRFRGIMRGLAYVDVRSANTVSLILCGPLGGYAKHQLLSPEEAEELGHLLLSQASEARLKGTKAAGIHSGP